MKLQLLSKGYTNAKLSKSKTESFILYMAPAKLNCLSVNLCPASTEGCRAACLYTAGRGAMSNVHQARLHKANWFVTDRAAFLKQLIAELTYLNRKAIEKGKRIAIRLNGTTDIDWENKLPLESYNGLQFYDYTKRINRVFATAESYWPTNYHLTYSASEVTADKTIQKCLLMGRNVAVVFSGKELPTGYLGFPVVSGDSSDERWLDPRGVIVGLIAKGRAKRDTSGFVRPSQSTSSAGQCKLKLVV